MSRDYGRLGGSRRSSVAVWQWLIIGIVVGLGCSAVIVLAMLTLGFLGINLDGTGIAFGPTPTARVVTATVDPSLPTSTPVVVVVTATQDATSTPEESQILAPTATIPVTEAPTNEIAATAEAAAPTQATITTDTSADPQVAGQSQVPPALAGIGSPLVTVDGGTFEMGTNFAEITQAVRQCTEGGGLCVPEYGADSQPAAPVTVDTFQIERTEVSYRQYIAFLNYLGPGSHLRGCGGFRCVDISPDDPASSFIFDTQNYDVRTSFQLDFPVANVTWHGANAYCQALGRRLPTEAEWERASRGRDNTIYPFGAAWDATVANAGKTGDEGEAPQPVESNPLGVSDFGALNMAGNMAEWVNDWYLATYYNQFTQGQNVNPQGPLSGVDKVIRGGSWADNPFFARAVHRQSAPPDNDYVWVGFRCASDVTETTTAPTGNTGIVPLGTVDPATLGSDLSTDSDVSAPTLPAAPAGTTLPPGGD